MDRQVPNDVHVVLKQAQAGTHAVIIINVAENAVADQLADFLNRGSIKEGVVYHQYQISSCRFFDKMTRLFGGVGERLLDQNVLAGSERRQGQLIMRVNRCSDRDSIDAAIL